MFPSLRRREARLFLSFVFSRSRDRSLFRELARDVLQQASGRDHLAQLDEPVPVGVPRVEQRAPRLFLGSRPLGARQDVALESSPVARNARLERLEHLPRRELPVAVRVDRREPPTRVIPRVGDGKRVVEGRAAHRAPPHLARAQRTRAREVEVMRARPPRRPRRRRDENRGGRVAQRLEAHRTLRVLLGDVSVPPRLARSALGAVALRRGLETTRASRRWLLRTRLPRRLGGGPREPTPVAFVPVCTPTRRARRRARATGGARAEQPRHRAPLAPRGARVVKCRKWEGNSLQLFSDIFQGENSQACKKRARPRLPDRARH